MQLVSFGCTVSPCIPSLSVFWAKTCWQHHCTHAQDGYMKFSLPLSPPFISTSICWLFEILWGFTSSAHTADLQIRPNEVMEAGARVYIPVSVAETRISKRFDTIPSGTLYPNADEIEYLQRLVKYKACLAFNSCSCYLLPENAVCLCLLLILYSFVSILLFVNWWLKFQDYAIIVLNKPPKLPVKVSVLWPYSF